MSVYLDTNVIVPLFLTDPFTSRARSFLTAGVSDFAAAEFASVVGVRCRTGVVTFVEGNNAFANFDVWTKQYAIAAETRSEDVRAVEAMLRRLDLVLRAPDAIHIAIAKRLGAELATFDTRMAECARALGAPLAAI